ncbi:MAG: carbohydrate-binding protein [Phormidesmis sp.]
MNSSRVEAESFVSAYDRTSGNSGKLSGYGDVDVEAVSNASGGLSVGWILDKEYLDYNITVTEAGVYRLDARVASARNGNHGFRILIADQAGSFTSGNQQADFALGNTGGWSSWKDISASTTVSLAKGTHKVRAYMLTDGFNLDYFDFVRTSNTGDTGSTGNTGSTGSSSGNTDSTGSGTGTTQLIRTQAESFVSAYDRTPGNSGKLSGYGDVDVEAVSNASGGLSVGWILDGEYLDYEITVPEAGVYRLDARVASARNGNHGFRILVADQAGSFTSGNQQQADFALGNTGGWSSWKDISAGTTVSLAKGTHKVRAYMRTSDFNLDYFDLVRTGDTGNTGSTGNTGNTGNTGGTGNTGNTGGTGNTSNRLIRVQAEDYKLFLDKTSQNLGGAAYRKDSVDISSTKDVGGGYAVTYIDPGEFLTYEVNVADGLYRLDARVAAARNGSKQFDISIGGQKANFEFRPNTGGWDTWETVSADTMVSLKEGSYQATAKMTTGGFNLNYFDFVRVSDNSISINTLKTSPIELGNTIKAGTGSKAVNGDSTTKSVNYAQASTGVAANLKSGTATYGVRSFNGGPLKIMPLGDSITEGVMASDLNGYRDDLWNLLKSNGYNIDFVGPKSTGNGSFDKDHAGFPGERIDQIAKRAANGLVTDYQPNAVLLMIGTNDNIQDYNFSDAADRLDSLIGQITNQVPSTKIFVASIPPDKIFSRQRAADEYNSKIPDIVKKYANATFIDMSHRLDLYDLEDSVHPTPTGNANLAEAWYEAIRIAYGNSGTTTDTDNLSNIKNIVGSNYDDILIGSSDSNILVGGKGDDILTGSGGGDKFVLEPGGGFDIITDFKIGEDLIVLSKGLNYEHIYTTAGTSFGYSDNDTLLWNDDSEKLALLSGVKSTLVNAASFAIA